MTVHGTLNCALRDGSDVRAASHLPVDHSGAGSTRSAGDNKLVALSVVHLLQLLRLRERPRDHHWRVVMLGGLHVLTACVECAPAPIRAIGLARLREVDWRHETLPLCLVLADLLTLPQEVTTRKAWLD